MGDLAADVYALAELPCWDLRNALADRTEAVSFQLNMEYIAGTLTDVGLDAKTAISASRLKPPPEARHRTEEWCRLWKITVRALGDYLLRVAERGRG